MYLYLQNVSYISGETKYLFFDWQIGIQDFHHNKGNAKIVFIAPDKNADNINYIKDYCRTFGYFEAEDSKIIKGTSGREYVQLCFEPYFEKDIRKYLREDMNCLYHAAPMIYKDNIENKGLIPQNCNSNQKYPPRIFLFKGNLDEHTIDEVLYSIYKRNNKGTDTYIIYKILLKDIKQNIYYDPDNEYCCYVEKTIEPKFLIEERTKHFD